MRNGVGTIKRKKDDGQRMTMLLGEHKQVIVERKHGARCRKATEREIQFDHIS